MADWNLIKAEYIAGGISYRKLAEKHGVSFTTLQRVGNRENWVQLRQQAADEVAAKIVESVSRHEAGKAVKINRVADKLLRKLSESIDRMDVIDSQTLKQFTSALKDIKDIKGEKSKIDLREQEARIARLEKDAAGEDKSGEIVVTFGTDAEEYGV